MLTFTFEVRAGTRALQTYFARARRPAATLLLLEQLNDANFARTRSTWMRQLVKTALPGSEMALAESTPLGMLEDMIKGRVE